MSVISESVEQVINTQSAELIYEIGSNLVPTHFILANELDELVNISNENERKEIIARIVKIYSSAEETESVVRNETSSAIIGFFTTYNNKKELRSFLLRTLEETKVINGMIKTTAEDLLDKMKETKICNLKHCNEFFHFVSVVESSSPNYNIEDNFPPLFNLCLFLFDSYTHHAIYSFSKVISQLLETLNTMMNAVFKQMLQVLVKESTFLNQVKERFVHSLFLHSYILLFNENMSFEIRTKVGLIFIHSFHIGDINNLQLTQMELEPSGCPPLAICSIDDEKFYNLFISVNQNYKDNDYVIFVYSSMCNAVPEETLCKKTTDGKTLICVLYEEIMNIAKRITSQPPLIVEASRTICSLGKFLLNIPVTLLTPMFIEGLDYVSSHLDHHVDSVRSYTKVFLMELVVLAANQAKNYEYGGLLEILLQRMEDMSLACTMRFNCFEYLAKYMGCDFILSYCKDLPETLLCYLTDPVWADIATKTYISIMESTYPADKSNEDKFNWTRTWVSPVLKCVKTDKDGQDRLQKMFSTAFKLQPTVLRVVFPANYIGTSEESACLLKCLNEVRKNGIELATIRDCQIYWRGLIDKQRMESYMVHQNDDIRILVLACIVDSLKSTELYIDWEFVFLINYIRYNISCEIPKIRKQMVDYYKKALCRYSAGVKVVTRNIIQLTKYFQKKEKMKKSTDNDPDYADHKKTLSFYTNLRKSYTRFIFNITKILIANLSYHSNHPRRAVSLELLIFIHGIMTTEEWNACWSEDDARNSHVILFDKYECNKKMIVQLLQTLPPKNLGFTNTDFTFKYLQKSMDLACEVRPSKPLAAAYLFEVCTFSEYFCDITTVDNDEQVPNGVTFDDRVAMISILLGKMMEEAPRVNIDPMDMPTSIYGLIFSIRHLLEGRDIWTYNGHYREIFKELVNTCLDVKGKLMPIVCNPSPEGYVPDSDTIDECEVDESSVAQKVLVYCWRTMKEITLVLAEVVKQSIRLETHFEMLDESLLEEIMKFFVSVFYYSKHRGVFEQAYVGFSVICSSFVLSHRDAIKSNPKFWLQDALDICVGKKVVVGISSTRRSAGLPFFILAVLASESSQNRACFPETIETLFKTAEEESPGNNEYRTHCMNVLRAIFRHSKFSEAVAPYVGRGVILSINGFRSEAWGVRNSATLLYASLITRMFGVQRTSDSEELSNKNRLTVSVFRLRYPELAEFLLKTLRAECDDRESLVLHPVLMIFARLYPSYSEQVAHVEEYIELLDRCLLNPSYRTRELAARSLVALLDLQKVEERLDSCFDKIASRNIKDCECHGLLLQIFQLIKATGNLMPKKNYIKDTQYLFHLVGQKFSHMTVNLYLEVVIQFLYNFPEYDDLQMLKNILLVISVDSVLPTVPFTWRNKFNQTKTILAIYIVLNKFEETDITYSTVSSQILQHLRGSDPYMKQFCLDLLISLNRVMFSKRDNYKDHPLFVLGELEIPSEIERLVDTFSAHTIKQLLSDIHPQLKQFIRSEIMCEKYLSCHFKVLLFLLANYYPCIINSMGLNKQLCLRTLTSFCDSKDQELTSAVLTCLSTFIEGLQDLTLDFRDLVRILERCASPNSAVCRRLSASEFLCKNYILYCNQRAVLQGEQLETVLNAIVVLLEDDELLVRNTMANFERNFKVKLMLNNTNQTVIWPTMPVVPEKAKEEALQLFTVLLPQKRAVSMLMSWAFRYFPDPACDPFDVFERGELNMYAENTPLIDVCSRILIKMLWALGDDLCYEDKTIFIEEKTLIVCGHLLDSVSRRPCPMILKKTRLSIIMALYKMYRFLEEVPINNNFLQHFRAFFSDVTLPFLTEKLEQTDMFSVKKVFTNLLYDPVYSIEHRTSSVPSSAPSTSGSSKSN